LSGLRLAQDLHANGVRVGDEQADWLLVGEAPGAEEDARREPFVGQAGRLLDNMLAAIGLARGENVYICNVLKCGSRCLRAEPASREFASDLSCG